MRANVRYLIFFALLYYLQGAALAYVVNFQKPFLAAAGIGKEKLGLFTSLLLLPFILKVFLGMLSDRVPWGRFGARKPYMTIGLALFAAAYLILGMTNPATDFPRFAVWTWLASFGLALFDTCADGWAIDVAEEHEQSAIQAAMIAGKSLGLITMSYAFGILAEQNGFARVFESLAGMSLVILVLVWLSPYQPRPRVLGEGTAFRGQNLLNKSYLLFAAYAVTYSIASFGTDGLLTLHLAEVDHLGSQAIGPFGVTRGIGALLGAAVFATSRMRLNRSLIVGLVALGAGCLLPLSSLPVLIRAGVWGAIWGFQETAFVTLAMRKSEGAWAATVFAICMIFSNLGTAIGEAIATPLVPQIGFDGVFVVLAAIAWMSLVFVKLDLGPADSGSINRST